MPDDDQTQPSMAAEMADPIEHGESEDAAMPSGRSGPRKNRISSQITAISVIGAAIAALLAISVVIAALDMKFQADQARWQQRQTCMEWYRLQADYGLGPWYEKLPAAAEDCGGGMTDDGIPLVPGGTQPAFTEADVPVVSTTTSTSTTLPPATDFPTAETGEGGP